MTAEGAVGDIQAVGVGPNRQLKEHALWLAMSTMILLRHPEVCEAICNDWGTKPWSNMVKDVKNLVQEEYLKKQTSLLIDFQGQMGQDKTTFAVLKPTEWFQWSHSSVCRASQGPAIYSHDGDEVSPKSNSFFILDMRSKANFTFLEQVLADENILKVCWGYKENMEAFMDPQLKDSSKVETAIQKVLDVEKAFLNDGAKTGSLSECVGRLHPTAPTRLDSPAFSMQQVGRVLEAFADSFKDATHNLLALEAFISRQTSTCYNKAWTETAAMIRECHCKARGQLDAKVVNETSQYKADSAALPAPGSLCFEVNGLWFVIVSDLPDFMQGRCTTPEKYNDVVWVQPYLRKQKSLLINFQGEMMGHAGEIYFAVIKSMSSNMFFDGQQGLREAEGDGLVDSTASTMETATTAVSEDGDLFHHANASWFLCERVQQRMTVLQDAVQLTRTDWILLLEPLSEFIRQFHGDVRKCLPGLQKDLRG